MPEHLNILEFLYFIFLFRKQYAYVNTRTLMYWKLHELKYEYINTPIFKYVWNNPWGSSILKITRIKVHMYLVLLHVPFQYTFQTTTLFLSISDKQPQKCNHPS